MSEVSFKITAALYLPDQGSVGYYTYKVTKTDLGSSIKHILKPFLLMFAAKKKYFLMDKILCVCDVTCF